jgi:hypothetical protein
MAGAAVAEEATTVAALIAAVVVAATTFASLRVAMVMSAAFMLSAEVATTAAVPRSTLTLRRAAPSDSLTLSSPPFPTSTPSEGPHNAALTLAAVTPERGASVSVCCLRLLPPTGRRSASRARWSGVGATLSGIRASIAALATTASAACRCQSNSEATAAAAATAVTTAGIAANAAARQPLSVPMGQESGWPAPAGEVGVDLDCGPLPTSAPSSGGGRLTAQAASSTTRGCGAPSMSTDGTVQSPDLQARGPTLLLKAALAGPSSTSSCLDRDGLPSDAFCGADEAAAAVGVAARASALRNPVGIGTGGLLPR